MPKCPECGVDMEGRDPVGHANDHWPLSIPDKDLPKDALKRRQQLLAMAGISPTPTTEKPGPEE